MSQKKAKSTIIERLQEALQARHGPPEEDGARGADAQPEGRSSPELYEMSVGHLFGDVWARQGLSLRERQLVTLAANIALARPTGNHSHYRSSEHLGITREGDHRSHHPGRPLRRLADDLQRRAPVQRGHQGRGRHQKGQEEEARAGLTGIPTFSPCRESGGEGAFRAFWPRFRRLSRRIG